MNFYSPLSLPRLLLLVIISLGTQSMLFAQESLEEIPTDNTNLWGMIQQGGWAMYPLGLCSLFMFFLIFYSWRETSRKRFVSTDSYQESAGLIAEFRVDEAVTSLSAEKTVLSRVMTKGLRRIKPDAPEFNKPKAEATLIEHLEAEENSIAQWVNYLNVVGAVSPMIGLLGTVSGMISAFQTIGQGGMGRPELLAGDIGEALITTASGLIVGIPAMLAYFVLKNRLSSAVVATSQVAADLMDELPSNVIFEED